VGRTSGLFVLPHHLGEAVLGHHGKHQDVDQQQTPPTMAGE